MLASIKVKLIMHGFLAFIIHHASYQYVSVNGLPNDMEKHRDSSWETWFRFTHGEPWGRKIVRSQSRNNVNPT